LLGTGKPVIVVSLGGPYDLAHFASAPTYIAAYGYQPDTLSALVATIFGAQPLGHLPVTIHRADDPAKILVPYGTGLGYPR
jgi:beta-N-acetylhexosaminidase